MRTSSATSPLFPREHGAYVQLGLALACGLVLGHGRLQAWSHGVLTFLLFLASGPALLLLRPAPPNLRRRAGVLLASLAVPALPAAWLAWHSATPDQAGSLLVPAALAALLSALVLAKREHTTPGELLAAWALSSAAYPVAILGHAEPHQAFLLALALAGVHTLGTTVVRAFLQSLRQGGRTLPRVFPPVLGLALMGLSILSGVSLLALTLVPGTVLAAWMLVRPLSPRHLKRLGWLLTATSAAGMLPMLFLLG